MENVIIYQIQCIYFLRWVHIIIYDDLPNVKRRDIYKQQVCEQLGITLLVIPFWWNQTIQSIAREIYFARPDLPVPTKFLIGDLISKEMPTFNIPKGNNLKYSPSRQVLSY